MLNRSRPRPSSPARLGRFGLALAILPMLLSGCGLFCDDHCREGRPEEGAVSVAAASAAAIDAAAVTGGAQPFINLRFEGAVLTGPFTCGDARFLRLDGVGSVRLRADTPEENQINSSTFSPDAGTNDGDWAPADLGPTLSDWSARWLYPSLGAEAQWGVFEAGFGSLGQISHPTCTQGLAVGLNVRTWRWSAVVPIAQHLAEGLAADNLAESMVIQVSDEVVLCPQSACGY